jgi:hypothetical protein
MSDLNNAFHNMNWDFKNGCKVSKDYVPSKYYVPFKAPKKCDGCQNIQEPKYLFTASGTQSVPDFKELSRCFVQGYVRRPHEDM